MPFKLGTVESSLWYITIIIGCSAVSLTFIGRIFNSVFVLNSRSFSATAL